MLNTRSTGIAPLLLLVASICSAAVEVEEAKPGYLAWVHLRIYGDISFGDVEQLPELFEAVKKRTPMTIAGKNPLVTVSLDSPGGSLVAALAIGRFLRQNMAETVVAEGSECSSACVFILASGVERNSETLSPRIGLHRPYLPQDVAASLTFAESNALYEELSEACRDYLRRMGMHSELMNAMLRVPARNVRYVSRDEAYEFGLLGEDAGFKEWARSQDIEEYGEAHVTSIERYLDCVARGGEMEVCRKSAGLFEPSD